MNSHQNTSKQPLRCAVIGLGMGAHHAHTFAKYEASELVAVADTNPEMHAKMSSLARQPKYYEDYRQMLQEVRPDAVAVALPNFLHKSVTVDCLQAGAHVICEKPAALNIDEALAMQSCAEKNQRRLAINLSQRSSGHAAALKKLSIDGRIGVPYHAYVKWTRRDGIPGLGRWFGNKSLSGGGPLIDLGVHKLDLALWLMGNPEPISVSGSIHTGIGSGRAASQGVTFDVEDFATGFVRLTGGKTLMFEVSWAGMQRRRDEQVMRIMGTEGAFEQEADGVWYHISSLPEGFQHLEIAPASGILGSMENFVNSVTSGAALTASIEDGVRIQRILDGLYQSANEGREVTL